MQKTIANPPELPTPAAYSHAIAVSGPTRTLYVAGQIGIDAKGNVPEGIEAQTRLAFENLALALKAGGMTLSDIVKTTVFMTNPDDYKAFGTVRSQILGDTKPASTLVYIDGLVIPSLLVEIEAIAVAAA